MDERKSVEGTNPARDKPNVSDSSAQLEHAAWQDGARTPIGTTRAGRVARSRSYSYRHGAHAERKDRARTPIGTARACLVARWRQCTPIGTAHARSLGASSPCKVDGTRAKDLWCVPAGFSQGPVCESRPGLCTRPGQIWVLGFAGGSTG